MMQHTTRNAIDAQGTASAVARAYVIGVDIGGTNLRLALAETNGSIVARWAASVVGISDPHRVVALICEGTDELLRSTGTPREALRSIAVGAPGITDVDQGIVIATSYLLGWRDVPLRDLLQSALHIPTAVDNDVNMATLGESWVGAAKGMPDFFFIAIGTGIGGGLMLSGELYRGGGWFAGEIGYMLVPGTSDQVGGPHEPGALEQVAGGQGIKSHWHNEWSEERTRLPRNLSATEIFDFALGGEPLAKAMLHRVARVLGYAIYNVSLVLNPPLIVLGGGVGMHPALGAEVQRVLAERESRATPRIVHSLLGAEAQLLGAVRLAINTAATHDGHTLL